MTSEPTTTAVTTTMPPADELDMVAEQLVAQARTDGLALTGPGGLPEHADCRRTRQARTTRRCGAAAGTTVISGERCLP